MDKIEIDWVLVKHESESELRKITIDGGGVYVFLYNDYPYYVGTAKKDQFGSRLNRHKNLFASAKRTFLDPNHFVAISNVRWIDQIKKINEDSLLNFVFVPGNPNNKVDQAQGRVFWDKLSIYIGKIHKPEETLIKGVELGLQRFLIKYSSMNENILPNIPGRKYTFFGKQESVNLVNNVSHDTSVIESSSFIEILLDHQKIGNNELQSP